LLVDAGADVNAQGGEYGNALQAAAYGANEGIVKLLVDAVWKEELAQARASGGYVV
ncbi:hypothetical protein K435DRAFT_860969, partial [Dendrothele bispora CBS 962.96]